MRQDPTGFQATPLLDHLVAKVLAGEATLDEVATVNQQLALPVSDRSGTLSLDQATNSLHTLPVPPRFDAHILWHRLQTRLATREGRPLGLGERFKAQPLRRSVWSHAAGVVLGTLLVIVGWMGVSHRFDRRLSSTMATYATANGQRATITLTDGSTVMLNVASRLEVPADYAAGNHTVRLAGEALFTVSHHDGTPLTVMAGPTVTRVLGTSFVVRRYGTDTVTTVAVSVGKVAVGTAIVTQDRLVEVGTRGVVRVGRADASQFGFATGMLILPSMPLAQAIPELDRWYNADIRLGDQALGTEAYALNVPAGSLSDLTDLLSVAFNVRVVRAGRVLTLFPR